MVSSVYTNERDSYPRSRLRLNIEPWLIQAVDDYQTATILEANGKHNWACYLAAQAAEKALKAMILYIGHRPGYSHSLNSLLNRLMESGFPAEKLHPLKPAARFLTRVELGARYPIDVDAPRDLYGPEESAQAIRHARDFLGLAASHVLSRSFDEYLAELTSREE